MELILNIGMFSALLFWHFKIENKSTHVSPRFRKDLCWHQAREFDRENNGDGPFRFPVVESSVGKRRIKKKKSRQKY